MQSLYRLGIGLTLCVTTRLLSASTPNSNQEVVAWAETLDMEKLAESTPVIHKILVLRSLALPMPDIVPFDPGPIDGKPDATRFLQLVDPGDATLNFKLNRINVANPDKSNSGKTNDLSNFKEIRRVSGADAVILLGAGESPKAQILTEGKSGAALALESVLPASDHDWLKWFWTHKKFDAYVLDQRGDRILIAGNLQRIKRAKQQVLVTAPENSAVSPNADEQVAIGIAEVIAQVGDFAILRILVSQTEAPTIPVGARINTSLNLEPKIKGKKKSDPKAN